MTFVNKAILVSALMWMSTAAAKPEPFMACELALGHIVSVQVQMPKDPSHPTFLLLPGLHRSILLSDPAVQYLTHDGAGAVTMNFSVQPFSLQIGSTPPRDAEVTLASLAAEVEAVADLAVAQLGLEDVIPVSLSFTGAVSTHLSRFPLIIDTVPLTSARAHAPYAHSYRESLLLMARWNPFVALQFEQTLDAFYRAHWVPHVANAIQTHDLSPKLSWEMVRGYTKLSRAAETFDWRDNLPSKDVARIFVLAENESPTLLRDQLAVVDAMKAEGYRIATVIVGDSGHVLPEDQPELFAMVLKAAAKGLIWPGSSIYIHANGDLPFKADEDHVNVSKLSGED